MQIKYEDASLAEIRSVSRVGVSDLGANAARIYRILDELKNRRLKFYYFGIHRL